MRYIISTLLLLTTVLSVSAQAPESATLQQLQINDLDVYCQSERVHVDFTLDISAIELGKNNKLVYTPVLRSSDGKHKQQLEKIVLNGRNVTIQEFRSPRMRVSDAQATVSRENGTSQSISYSTSVPYEPWMDNSTLSLSEDSCGCWEIEAQSRKDLTSFVGAPAPQIIVLFTEPLPEQRKVRHEKGSASVDFIVNRFEIHPDYHNNRAEINKIISTIDLVKQDSNVEITDINIHGYASPEGSYEHNAYLAENRTRALTEYVKSLYDIPADIFTTNSTAEDWEGFRACISESSYMNRDEILDIIDDASLAPDAKDRLIKQRYPSEYEVILHSVYPSLRHSDYTISYIVRPFSAEEALEIMKVTPGQVSLYEMYWAAHTLGVNTEEYNEVINIAVRTYPDEPVANYNAAVVSANKGDYESALKYLEKVPESAKTLNIKGVMALNSGDYAAAREYFSKAVEQGMPEASANVEMIDKLNMLRHTR